MAGTMKTEFLMAIVLELPPGFQGWSEAEFVVEFTGSCNSLSDDDTAELESLSDDDTAECTSEDAILCWDGTFREQFSGGTLWVEEKS